ECDSEIRQAAMLASLRASKLVQAGWFSSALSAFPRTASWHRRWLNSLCRGLRQHRSHATRCSPSERGCSLMSPDSRELEPWPRVGRPDYTLNRYHHPHTSRQTADSTDRLTRLYAVLARESGGSRPANKKVRKDDDTSTCRRHYKATSVMRRTEERS